MALPSTTYTPFVLYFISLIRLLYPTSSLDVSDLGNLTGSQAAPKFPHGRAVADQSMRLPRIAHITWRDILPSSATTNLRHNYYMGLGQIDTLPGNWEMDSGVWDKQRSYSSLAPRMIYGRSHPAVWPRRKFRAFQNHAGTSTWRVIQGKDHVTHASSPFWFCRRRTSPARGPLWGNHQKPRKTFLPL